MYGDIFVMEIIKKSDAINADNSAVCKIVEYSFTDKDIDLGVATITGRYPENGYCANLVSKELVYILEGSGNVCFESKTLNFSAGDSILIGSGEKYYWDTKYCKVALVCAPAWHLEQYELTD